ncbi:MAG: hypothetical protein J1E82_05385 [Muribaculaceae bacterium]|nr:hypothetical protein [Muribaculaceae bacterium]
MKTSLFILPLVLLAMSCTSHRYVYSPDAGKVSDPYKIDDMMLPKDKMPKIEVPTNRVKLPTQGMIPNATAFRMSGDYANNVAITLNNNGEIIYFPAPTDITADSKPIQLANGWWLNNQGFGQNSVFTTYTFAEYAELPAVPTPEQLKNAIIPGARVTGFIELPCPVGEASSCISEINSYLSDK